MATNIITITPRDSSFFPEPQIIIDPINPPWEPQIIIDPTIDPWEPQIIMDNGVPIEINDVSDLDGIPEYRYSLSGTIKYRNNIKVKYDSSSNVGVPAFEGLEKAIVETVSLGFNDQISSVKLIFPNKRFGELIQFGVPIKVICETTDVDDPDAPPVDPDFPEDENIIFKGVITEENGVLSVGDDSVSCEAWDAKYLLNGIPVFGQYFTSDYVLRPGPLAEGLIRIIAGSDDSKRGFIATLPCVFNEKLEKGGEPGISPNMTRHVITTFPYRCFAYPHGQYFTSAAAMKTELWRWGMILQYLYTYYIQPYYPEIILDNGAVTKLNDVSKYGYPLDFSLEELSVTQAISKIIKEASSSLAWFIDYSQEYQVIKIKDYNDARGATVTIGPGSEYTICDSDSEPTVGTTNVSSITMTRSINDIHSRYLVIGAPIEIETTIELVPVYDLENFTADQYKEWAEQMLGSKELSGEYKDLFKKYRIPKNPDLLKAYMAPTHMSEINSVVSNYMQRNGITYLKDFFKYALPRKVRPPETDLTANTGGTDSSGDNLMPVKYKDVFIWSWDMRMADTLTDKYPDEPENRVGALKIYSADSNTLNVSGVKYDADNDEVIFDEPGFDAGEMDTEEVDGSSFGEVKEDVVDLIDDDNLQPNKVFLTAVFETDFPLCVVWPTDLSRGHIPFRYEKLIKVPDAKLVVRAGAILQHDPTAEGWSGGGLVIDVDEDDNINLYGDTIDNQPKWGVMEIDQTADSDKPYHIHRDDSDALYAKMSAEVSNWGDQIESAEIILLNLDTSYKVGDKITDIINSEKYGTGYFGLNMIITRIVHNIQDRESSAYYQTTIVCEKQMLSQSIVKGKVELKNKYIIHPFSMVQEYDKDIKE